MKIANIIGVFAGIAGILITVLNFHLKYAEGPDAIGGIMNKHDNVGNVFRLLSVLFFVLTVVCVFNLYMVSRSKGGHGK